MYCAIPSNQSLSFIDYPENEHCLTIMFTGCDNNCKGCQNKELQEHGKIIDEIELEEMCEIIDSLSLKMETKNIVIQGGDPLDSQNVKDCIMLCSLLKTKYNICVYTGKELNHVDENLLDYVDYIKCGKYDETKKVLSEKTDSYLQLASTNQKIYKNGELISKNGRIYF